MKYKWKLQVRIIYDNISISGDINYHVTCCKLNFHTAHRLPMCWEYGCHWIHLGYASFTTGTRIIRKYRKSAISWPNKSASLGLTPWQNNMDKTQETSGSMLFERCFWRGMVQVNLKNHDFGNFRDYATWHLAFLGGIYMVLGFGPLTWNITRKSMLKPHFSMVHANQNKIRCGHCHLVVVRTI